MNGPELILSQLKTQIEGDATLSAYVKKVFLGVREDIADFPCIVLEPLSLTEDDEIYTRQELNFKVGLIGYINVIDADKQIVGSDQVKGILAIENDVKKAISKDLTLGGKVIHSRILETRYEFVDYPIRSFTMDINHYFRQDLKTRA